MELCRALDPCRSRPTACTPRAAATPAPTPRIAVRRVNGVVDCARESLQSDLPIDSPSSWSALARAPGKPLGDCRQGHVFPDGIWRFRIRCAYGAVDARTHGLACDPSTSDTSVKLRICWGAGGLERCVFVPISTRATTCEESGRWHISRRKSSAAHRHAGPLLTAGESPISVSSWRWPWPRGNPTRSARTPVVGPTAQSGRCRA